MEVQEIPVDLIDISEANTRKDLQDGQIDSTIVDLARSIEQQGLLSPIAVFLTADGRYALVAGQRRLLAFKHLSRASIPAIVHETMSEEAATAVSLVENVHRADMNPRDKAVAQPTPARSTHRSRSSRRPEREEQPAAREACAAAVRSHAFDRELRAAQERQSSTHLVRCNTPPDN